MSNKSPVGAHHHITPVWVYVVNLVALLIFMLATVIAAQYSLPGGTLTNNIVAMAIACTKASLVILIFMGVWFTTKLAKLWSILGFIWLTFAFGILIDYKTRDAVEGYHSDPGSAYRAPGAATMPNTPGDDAVEIHGKAKEHE